MLFGGPIATILLVRGRVDDHRRTDEMFRLRRLSNPIVTAEGAADGLTTLKLLRSGATPGVPPAPGLLVVDMDRSESSAFLASIADTDGLGELNIVVLDEVSDDGPDISQDLAVMRIARPATLQSITTAAASFDRFHFEVEAIEQPGRYETRLWLCHKTEQAVHLDLSAPRADNVLLHE